MCIQFSHSVVSNSLRPHGLQHCQASLSITNSWSLLKLLPIKSVVPSNHIILCRPLLLPPSVFPSTRVFSNESVLISFRLDWLDLHAVQGSFLQHCNSKASILQWPPWNPLNPPWSSRRSYPERSDFIRVYCKVPRAATYRKVICQQHNTP